MNLRYNDVTGRHPTPEDYFAVAPDYPSAVIADGRLMIALLTHLRHNVPGPDLEVHIQMFGVWFYHPDYPGGTRVEPRNQQLRISYSIPDTWSGWDYATVIGQTANVSTATEMLFASFMRRGTPKDWRHHLLYPHGQLPKRKPETYRHLAIRPQRISSQHGETLHTYYRRLHGSANTTLYNQADGILTFLDAIISNHGTTAYWCYTADTHLIITDRDTDAPGVTVIPDGNEGYTIQYALAQHRAPWPDAQIEGTTRQLGEAIHMTVIALERLFGAS
jgi:hypothetical protein